MKNKFTMNLVWHNCKTYPPKEEYNGSLYVTDGKWVFEAIYYVPDGWFDRVNDEQVPLTDLDNYWWADVEQTVQTSKEFDEIRRNGKTNKTCKDCTHFIGGGDWNLCCTQSHEGYLFGFLCYEDTPVCEKFEEKKIRS